jgi:hypothetical protein
MADFDTPVISVTGRWLVFGGWFLIFSSKVIFFSERHISLRHFCRDLKFKWKNRCTRHSRLTNTVTARLKATVASCSFVLSDSLMT